MDIVCVCVEYFLSFQLLGCNDFCLFSREGCTWLGLKQYAGMCDLIQHLLELLENHIRPLASVKPEGFTFQCHRCTSMGKTKCAKSAASWRISRGSCKRFPVLCIPWTKPSFCTRWCLRPNSWMTSRKPLWTVPTTSSERSCCMTNLCLTAWRSCITMSGACGGEDLARKCQNPWSFSMRRWSSQL